MALLVASTLAGVTVSWRITGSARAGSWASRTLRHHLMADARLEAVWALKRPVVPAPPCSRPALEAFQGPVREVATSSQRTSPGSEVEVALGPLDSRGRVMGAAGPWRVRVRDAEDGLTIQVLGE